MFGQGFNPRPIRLLRTSIITDHGEFDTKCDTGYFSIALRILDKKLNKSSSAQTTNMINAIINIVKAISIIAD